MKPLFKIVIALLLIPFVGNANVVKKKHEKSRTIKKEFKVNKDAKVSISNKYGDVKVTTWNENRVEIEVNIIVKGDDLDDVQNWLDNIDVEFENSSSFVSAKTTIEKSRKSWTFWKNNNKTNYKINYIVKMPITNDADLSNDYGSIMLNNLKGTANINCDYGKISIGELNAESNSVNLDYCSNSTIGYINSGSINTDYSKITIEESKDLNINSDYSTLTIEKAKTVDFNTDYGSITIDEADEIKGNTDYTEMRFGTINKTLKIDSDYGSLSIKNLTKGFDFIDIDAQYTGIRIDVASGTTFNFEIDLQYASLRGNKDKMDFSKQISKNTKKYYEGKFGTGNSSSKIKIDSQYGGVSIKEN